VWDTDAATSVGSAPQITITSTTLMSRTYLTVTITDPDGDLATAAYASGSLTAEQFQGGSRGRTFTVGRNGTTYFSVTGSGTYTFYAADSAGNETVQTVTVTSRSRWFGLRSGLEDVTDTVTADR
jgi:hypothetical protein